MQTLNREGVLNYPGGALYYGRVPEKLRKRLHEVIAKDKPQKHARSKGLVSLRSIYGAQPGLYTRGHACRITPHTFKNAENYQTLVEAMQYIEKVFKGVFPEKYEAAKKFADKICPAYRIGNPTIWLTCNLNHNTKIGLHKDSANAKMYPSVVMILSKGCTGGQLSIPQLGVRLSQGDGWFSIMDGRNLNHGVETFTLEPDGYRVSTVFYTMEQMARCKKPSEEIARFHKESKR